jgi:fatty-acyl-CoA synthase
MGDGQTDLIHVARGLTVTGMVKQHARLSPDAIAIETAEYTLSYARLQTRVHKAATVLTAIGGQRFAVLSENRAEYLEVMLATARIGALLGCQNVRLAQEELRYCIDLIEPSAIFVSPRMAERHAAALPPKIRAIIFGPEYESLLHHSGTPTEDRSNADARWLVLYTGGTTGLPKGAILTQAIEIARMTAMRHDLGMQPGGACLAWPPLYHMGGADPALATLAGGGRVIVQDGFDPDRIAKTLGRVRFPWVSVMPGAAAQLADALERAGPVLGVGAFGVMPDLVPPSDIARLARLMRAPWCNSFGATETGTPPFSTARIHPDETEPDFGKLPSPDCAIRLVDTEDRDVELGEVGEIALRGPTLFAGYWRNEAATAHDFRGGWFHMGDLFRRRPDGRFDFVERAKYLIKSGGENIYPAEIERILLSHADVAEAVVVRRPDARWGEVPVALVARRQNVVTPEALAMLCRAHLAGYKQPKQILIVEGALLARSPTGKISRPGLEAWVLNHANNRETAP